MCEKEIIKTLKCFISDLEHCIKFCQEFTIRNEVELTIINETYRDHPRFFMH